MGRIVTLGVAVVLLATSGGGTAILGDGGAKPPASSNRYELHEYSKLLQVVFDGATGRIYKVEDLEKVHCIDPVAGTLAKRPLVEIGPGAAAGEASGPGPDTTTREGAARAVLDALKHGQGDVFRQFVTRRVLERHAAGKDFDEWFAVWQRGCAEMTPETLAEGVRWVIAEEWGWQIDEN